VPLTALQLTQNVLQYAEHGGSCCGIYHIHSFPAYLPTGATLDCRKRIIEAAVANCLAEYEDNDDYFTEDAFNEDSWKMAIECVLTNRQLPDWQEALEAVGFKLVFSWDNSNSGNTCNMFVKGTNQ